MTTLDPDKIVGSHVRAIRMSQRLTQRHLADRLRALGWEIDPTGVTRLEQGARALQLRQLYLVAEALDVAPEALLAAQDDQFTWRYRELRGAFVALRAAVGTRVIEFAELADALRDGASIEGGPATPEDAVDDIILYATQRAGTDPGPLMTIFDPSSPGSATRDAALYQRLAEGVVSGLIEGREIPDGIDPEAP